MDPLVADRQSRPQRRDRFFAERYRRGDLSPSRLDFGDDEIGTVARTLDEAVQEVARRLAEQARDHARMEAILAGK